MGIDKLEGETIMGFELFEASEILGLYSTNRQDILMLNQKCSKIKTTDLAQLLRVNCWI